MKSATNGSFHCPVLVEIGSVNKKVPKLITARNPRQMVREIVMKRLSKGNNQAKSKYRFYKDYSNGESCSLFFR